MNRPEARNALSPDMLVGLADGYTYVDETPEIRCAILTGAGGHFSSGADLKAMGTPSESEHVRNRMAETPNLHWKALLRDYRLSKPLIAAVEGYAVAGGTEMLQGTDIRVAGEGAIFGVWEGKRGLFPLGGSAIRLPRQIPYTIAMDILLSSKPVSALEAQQIGLIGRVVPDRHRARRRARDRRAGRGVRPALHAGDPAGLARDRVHDRGRGDADPGQDRLGGLRLRGRAGGPARVRREAHARVQGQVSDSDRVAIRSSPPQRERLAEAVRHVIDAVLTVEDATEEQLGTAADMTEAVARHLGREPHADDAACAARACAPRRARPQRLPPPLPARRRGRRRSRRRSPGSSSTAGSSATARTTPRTKARRATCTAAGSRSPSTRSSAWRTSRAATRA